MPGGAVSAGKQNYKILYKNGHNYVNSNEVSLVEEVHPTLFAPRANIIKYPI